MPEARIPPHNLDAEISTLGSLMLNQDAVHNVIDILKPEDFYDEKHEIIYNSIYDLCEKNSPIDVLSVSAHLKEKNLLKKIGSNSYLTQPVFYLNLQIQLALREFLLLICAVCLFFPMFLPECFLV